MIEPRKQRDGTVRYRVRVGKGKESLGTFATKREAKRAQAEWEVSAKTPRSGITADVFADRWADGERWNNKLVRQSTIDTGRHGVKGFKKAFKGVPLERIDHNAALAFARAHKSYEVLAAKALMADATKRGLIGSDPFAHIASNRGPGRKFDRVLAADEVDFLAAKARETYPGEFGQHFAGAIYFAAYVGPRISMQLALERADVDFRSETVTYRASFDRLGNPVPWTKETEEGQEWPVVLLPEAARPLHDAVARVDGDWVFRAKRGGRLRPNNHWSVWNPVRAAAGFPDLDWHGLRHFCGHHFYVTLGFTAELAGYQLCHHDGEQIRKLYGHGQQDALARLRQGVRGPRVVDLAERGGPQAARESGGAA